MSGINRARIVRRTGELAMIVVGVLIALAANAWWVGRTDRAIASDYRARLTTELQRNRLLIDTVTLHTKHVRLATDSLVMFLEDVVDIGGDSRVVVNAYNATRRWGQRFSTETFDELVSTAGFRLLPNPKLRAAIGEVYGDMRTYPADWYGAEYRAIGRRTVPVSIQLRIRRECVEISSPDWDACSLHVGERHGKVAVNALRSNPAVLGALRIQAHDITVFERNIARLREQIDTALLLLAR